MRIIGLAMKAIKNSDMAVKIPIPKETKIPIVKAKTK